MIEHPETKQGNFWLVCACFLFTLLLGACQVESGALPQAPPTISQPVDTPTSTGTPSPSSTLAPSPTSTQTSTLLPMHTSTVQASTTAQPSPRPGQMVSVGIGGFSFQAVEGYLVQINVSQATISDPQGLILISMTGASPQETLPVEQLLQDFINNIAADLEIFEASDAYPYSIAGFEGLAADLSGVMFNEPFQGRVLAVLPGEGRQFILMAIGNQTAEVDHWVREGQAVFQSVVDTLQFFEPTDSACPVSADASYGYTPENPIRVGGDAFGGPFRERIYLDNLRGPSFEVVAYERMGSKDFGNTILDLYELSYPGLSQPVLIYIDEYSYSEPTAPLGLKCPQPFELPPP
jgi:hypothetical protein